MDESTEFIVDQTVPGVLKLHGELDMATAEVLFAAVAETDDPAVEIDLSGVTFADSSGLSAMLHIRREHPLAQFVHPSPRLARLLETTGMTKLLGIHDTASRE